VETSWYPLRKFAKLVAKFPIKTLSDRFSEDLKILRSDLDKHGDDLCHALERQSDTFDKRLDDLRQDIGKLSDRIEKLNQNFIDHLSHHERVGIPCIGTWVECTPQFVVASPRK
jgi:hypothetical protein